MSDPGEIVRELAERDDDSAASAVLSSDLRRKISSGVAGLRAGLGVDGETFMAGLDADLARRERHGP